MSLLRDVAHNRRRTEQVSDVLAYLGIAITFATVTLIGCITWLLIW
jgi:hypothetical protein